MPLTTMWFVFASTAILLLLAARVWLSRFALLFDRRTLFTGVSYSDAHVSIHFLLLTSVALVLGAIVAAINSARRPTARMLAVAVARGAYLLLHKKHATSPA